MPERACPDGGIELTFLTPPADSRVSRRAVPLGALVVARARAARAAAAIGLPAQPARARAAAAARRRLLRVRARGRAARRSTGTTAARNAPTSRRSSSSSLPLDARLLRARRRDEARACPSPQRRAACGDPAGAGRHRRTDRPGLPYLFPTLDAAQFAIDTPGGGRARVAAAAAGRTGATSFDAIASLGAQGFFAPGLERRVCVVLTDGERPRPPEPTAAAGSGRPALGSGRADLQRRQARAPVPAGRCCAGARVPVGSRRAGG